MSDRTVPASPRRRALARTAGLIAHSPTLTTAAAWAAAVAALLATAPRAAAQLRAAMVRGLAGTGAPAEPAGATAVLVELLWGGLVEAAAIALPVLAASALAALLVHAAQTRALWMPRRQVRGAPSSPRGLRARALSGLWSTVRGCALAGVGVGWLLAALPAVAASLRLGAGAALPASASLVVGAALALVVTWIALGILELLGRTAALAASARMTPAEQREELRATGGAARGWAAQRRERGQGGERERRARELRLGLSDAALVIVGDELAIAVAWHPRRTPVPRVVATRRGREVSYLLALARRDAVPIRRAPALAHRLAAAAGGEVPAAVWTELAALVALARQASSGAR